MDAVLNFTTAKWIWAGRPRTSSLPGHVDIQRQVVERKRLACIAHDSQNHGSCPSTPRYHEPTQRFRGLEYRCQAAEAFVRAPAQNPPRYSLPAWKTVARSRTQMAGVAAG